jgi:hypothetical protein
MPTIMLECPLLLKGGIGARIRPMSALERAQRFRASPYNEKIEVNAMRRTLFLIAAMFGPRFFFWFLVLFCAFCALAFYAITR